MNQRKVKLIYEPGTKIGVVFQTSVLDEMLTVRKIWPFSRDSIKAYKNPIVI